MIVAQKHGIGVVNTSMTDVSLDETIAKIKFEDGSYLASSKQLENIPDSFRTIVTDFTYTDGMTWLTKQNEEGDKNIAFSIAWNNKKEPIKIQERVIKNKKEYFKDIDIDTFKEKAGLEKGINRVILEETVKQLIRKMLENNAKILFRNKNVHEALEGARNDSLVVVGEKDIERVIINNETKEKVQQIAQTMYTALEPEEELSLRSTLEGKLSKDESLEQLNIIFNELKSGDFQNYDIGKYVKFSPATMAALQADPNTLKDNGYKEHAMYVKDALSDGIIGSLEARTNLGGYISAIIPSLNNEVIVYDMRMLPTASAFDKNEKFTKNSQTIAIRKELKLLVNNARKDKKNIPEVLKKYKEFFDEIAPEFMTKKEIGRFVAELENSPQQVLSFAYLNKVMNESILKEKDATIGTYDDLIVLSTAKGSNRLINSGRGLSYRMATKITAHNDMSIVATATIHQDIKKRDMGEGVDIKMVSRPEVSMIHDSEEAVFLNRKLTIPEKLGYIIQDIQKVDNSGTFEYTTTKDGEAVVKTKTVDVAGHVEKAIQIIDEALEFKTNKGVSTALLEFKKELSDAMVSGDVIPKLKEVFGKKDALYAPLVEAAQKVNTLAISTTRQKNYIGSIYSEEIKVALAKLNEIATTKNAEEADFISFTPKTKIKDERSRHGKVMVSIQKGIISNFELMNWAKEKVEAEVKTMPRFQEYVVKAKQEQREITSNIINFHPKINEANLYMSALKNRMDGALVTFNKLNMHNVTDSLFLKDVKVKHRGQEYDAKAIRSFSEINKNLDNAKNNFIAEMKEVESIIPEVSRVLKEKQAEKNTNVADIFNAVMNGEKQQEKQEVVEEKIQETKEVREEIAATIVEEHEIVEDAPSDVIDETPEEMTFDIPEEDYNDLFFGAGEDEDMGVYNIEVIDDEAENVFSPK